MSLQPAPVRWASSGMVATVDHLASSAGTDLLRRGGSAADAAVGASAVLAVTSQHLCGMGGDLWAVVHPGGSATPVALDASGRAGSGADPDRLRERGLAGMPAFGDPASVTVPGCVDGWLALHDRFGRLPLGEVFAAARGYAMDGFPASPGLVASLPFVAGLPDADDYRVEGRFSPGSMVRREGVGRALDGIAASGRDGFYGGEFGAGFLTVTAGEHTEADLARPQADWTDAVAVDAWGHRIWSAPPASQGYLTLASAWIANGLDLPDPSEPGWAHLLVEAARAAAHDRLALLHEGADPAALLDPVGLAERRRSIDPERAADLGVATGAGDTIGLVAVDADRMGVSLLQSNASGWGSGLVAPGSRIFLHNRGRGFSLEPGHPAGYAPGRRPPHTLCPTLVTGPGGRLRAALATMGGDAQPQILLQLLARLLAAGEDPAAAVAAGRWALGAPLGPGGEPGGDGFETWAAHGRVALHVEGQCPPDWTPQLTGLGHEVAADPAWSSAFGHAHLVDAGGDALCGASDPRASAGGVAGW